MPVDVVAPVKNAVKERIIREFFRTISYPRKNIIDELLTDRPFDFSSPWQEKFLEAMRWSFRHHYNNSEFYRKLCMQKGFDESRVNSFEDVWDIPFVLSDVFKFYDVETKTNDIVVSEMSSSGTSGRKSRIKLDRVSGQRLLCSLYHINKAVGLVGSMPTNYFMMSYDPAIDDTLGTTTSDVMMSYLTPRKGVFYGLAVGGNEDIGFSKDRSVEKLRQFVEEGFPIRMLGFIHHICEVITGYREKYGRVAFPGHSYIISGGGWKGAVNPYGADFNLYTFLQENTIIDPKNVRDLYTLIEHEVFYLECENHNKHIPNVAMACSRDPRTLKRLGYGEKGLIHLYSPLIESCPTLSLLTTDYGYIGESCSCSLSGPYIKIAGRAGVTKKVTCALTADQYVNPVRKDEVLTPALSNGVKGKTTS